MIKNRNETSAAMDKALKNLEQAKARYEAERKKENEKRRKAQNHHKYLMGGIVAKYFPECYQYEEKELNVILSAALASAECRQAVENVKRMEKNADEMEDEKDRNGGHADETKLKAEVEENFDDIQKSVNSVKNNLSKKKSYKSQITDLNTYLFHEGKIQVMHLWVRIR